MNRIILLGRLVRDPEVRVTPTEKNGLHLYSGS